MYIQIQSRVHEVLGNYYNVVLVRGETPTKLGFYPNEHQAFVAAIMASRTAKALGHGDLPVDWEKQ